MMKKRNRNRRDGERRFMNAVSVLREGMNYNTLEFASFTANLSNQNFSGCRRGENRVNIRRFVECLCPETLDTNSVYAVTGSHR
jgi:hypothetical protein